MGGDLTTTTSDLCPYHPGRCRLAEQQATQPIVLHTLRRAIRTMYNNSTTCELSDLVQGCINRADIGENTNEEDIIIIDENY